jgi:hypothetical protein
MKFGKNNRKYSGPQAPIDPTVLKARAEQRAEFNSILEDVNKFAYSNMTSTRKERALKKQWENARAEALGCTPEKGVNHGYKHLKEMRAAKAHKRDVMAEKARQGEDVDTRSNLYRDVTEVRKLRKDKRKEARDRKSSRGMQGEDLDKRKTIKSVMKKYT